MKNNKLKKQDNSTDEREVRNFTTCEEYREYMKGNPDKNRDKCCNPVPEDAMTLAELGERSKEEILGIINQMGETDNKSDIRTMYAHGYGFSWGELVTIAAFLGFYKDSGSSREVHYSAKGVEEMAPPKKENSSLLEEIFSFQKSKRAFVRKSIFVFQEDAELFKKIVSDNTVYGLDRMGQAVLFSKMLKVIAGKAVGTDRKKGMYTDV